jgi:uncharacterized protein (TIGR00369 family)
MSTRGAVGLFWDMIEGRRPFSPSSELLGFKILSVDTKTRSMEAEFRATRQFLNAGGAVQGGIITAMLDDTMSYAGAVYLKGTHALPTLEIKTSFMRPAFIGSLFGTGKLVHRGRDFVFLEGSLRDKDAKLIATATASARMIPIADLLARIAVKETLPKAS